MKNFFNTLVRFFFCGIFIILCVICMFGVMFYYGEKMAILPAFGVMLFFICSVMSITKP